MRNLPKLSPKMTAAELLAALMAWLFEALAAWKAEREVAGAVIGPAPSATPSPPSSPVAANENSVARSGGQARPRSLAHGDAAGIDRGSVAAADTVGQGHACVRNGGDTAGRRGASVGAAWVARVNVRGDGRPILSVVR